MDERDLRILARLAREPLAPVAALARDARLTPNAARARLDRLAAGGVYMGVYALPHPELFGRVARIAVYAPPRKPVDAERVLAVDDVLMHSVNHDGQVAATYLARGPDDPPPAALDRIMGAPAPRVFVRESPPLAPRGAVLGADAWRVVEALQEDGRATHRAVAARTGLSERVVARHRAKLLRGNALVPVAGVLSNLAAGVVLYHLYVQGKGAADERAVCALVGGIVQERTRAPDGLYVLCQGATLAEAVTARERVGALPGIDHVELVLEKEGGVATARLLRMCREARERDAARLRRGTGR